MQICKFHIIKHSSEGPPNASAKLYLRRLERERKMTKKWKPCPELEETEAKLDFEIKFAGQTDRAGLGSRDRYRRNPTLKEKRKRLMDGIKHAAEAKATLHSLSLTQQGSWTRWIDDVNPPVLKWKDLIFARNPKLMTHQINAMANCLPAPDMKLKWVLNPRRYAPSVIKAKAHKCAFYPSVK